MEFAQGDYVGPGVEPDSHSLPRARSGAFVTYTLVATDTELLHLRSMINDIDGPTMAQMLTDEGDHLPGKPVRENSRLLEGNDAAQLHTWAVNTGMSVSYVDAIPEYIQSRAVLPSSNFENLPDAAVDETQAGQAMSAQDMFTGELPRTA